MNTRINLSIRLKAGKIFAVSLFLILVNFNSELAAQNFPYQGSRYYYGIIGTGNYAAECQALYDTLVAKAEILHHDFTTTYTSNVYCTINLEDYGFQRNQYNTYDLVILDAVDLAFAAFFQDNVQYFMLRTNAGMTENYELTVEFDALTTGQATALYDYRLPADRISHVNRINAAFAKYQQLTQNATSKYEKARIIHDKIVSDWDYSTNTFAPGAHTLMGGMGYAVDGIVCEGYSKMFAFMATNLGVPAILAPGDMIANDGYPAGAHVWNLALMDDGKYYFLDLTWVDNQRTNLDVGNYRNPLNYAWFLKGHDNGVFESKHYAGVGSMLTPYVNPSNLGGADYDYKNLYNYTFLGDIPAGRTSEFNLGTYHLPAGGGALNIQPKYYDQNLVYGVDYEMEYELPLHLGKNRVWFMGKGNYRGFDFGVVTLVATGATLPLTVSLSSEMYEYTGTAITPVPTVTNGTVTLVAGQDYTVSYQNNTNLGTAKAVITGMGMYAGMVYEKNFQIIIMSSGTVISAADCEAMFPTAANILIVIRKPGGPANMQQNALAAVQNAANYYNLPVYYVDWFADITNYSFYNSIMGAFPGMGVDSVAVYPVLAVVKTASDFCIDAAEKHITTGGYQYGLMDAADVRQLIMDCLGSITTQVEIPEQPSSAQAHISNGKLYISGLTACHTCQSWILYDENGRIVHQEAATGDTAEFVLPARGIYILKYGNTVRKLMY